VIPAMGVVATVATATFGATPWQLACAGLAGAACAAAIRMLTNDSPAALTAAGLAALLAIGLVLEQHHATATTWLALAATSWTIAELARTTRATSAPLAPATSPATSPIVALLPALLAAILEPACASLLVLAGIRMVTAPWQRPRWIVAVPIAGAVVTLLAIVSGPARGGVFGALGNAWYGHAHRISPSALASALGAALGPLVAVAALAGLALVARAIHRGALAELAILGCAGGALLVDLRAGSIGPTTLGLAALVSGLAVGRLAGMIRIPSGQAVVGTACGALLLVAPAYTALLAHYSR